MAGFQLSGKTSNKLLIPKANLATKHSAANCVQRAVVFCLGYAIRYLFPVEQM